MAVYTGNEFNDVLTGSDADDVIDGLGGNDDLTGGSGSDDIDGGRGSDILLGDTGSFAATGGNDTLDGGEGADLLIGGLGNDVLSGGADDDVIIAGLGSSYRQPNGSFTFGTFSFVDGGDDSVDGGEGNDQAYFAFARPGGITLSIADPATAFAILADGTAIGTIRNVERLVFAGGTGGDVVTGGALRDALRGGGGNDRLIGGGGDDELEGGPGDDVLDGAAGFYDFVAYAFVDGAVTVDLRVVGVAQDTGAAGRDTLIGIEHISLSDYAGHADTLIGDGGANTFNTFGAGSDTLSGNGGSDYLLASRSGGGAAFAVTLSGGADDDVLNYSASGASLYKESATLDGGDGGDAIVAYGLGIGTILGGAGIDAITLDTLGGSFTVTLGTDAADTITLAATNAAYRAANAIVVTDFSTGPGGDRLALSGWLGSALIGYAAGSNPFTTGFLQLVQAGADALLQADRDGAGAGYAMETLATFRNTTATAFSVHNTGFAQVEQTTQTGTAGPDALTGTGSDDTLSGIGGDDDLIGLAGNDNLSGGDGMDLLAGDASTFEVAYGGADILAGGIGSDLIVGGLGNDSLSGGEGDDILHSGLAVGAVRSNGFWNFASHTTDGGDDTIDGGIGRDHAYLAYQGRAAGITLNNASSTATNIIYANGAAAGAVTGVEELTFYGGAGADDVTGGAGYDYLDGGIGDDRVDGGGGNDTLVGGVGSDTLIGGFGIDQLQYSTGGDMRVDLSIDGAAQDTGASGMDTLSGIENVSVAHFGTSTAVLIGNAAGNALYLYGDGTGAAELHGGEGNDTLIGGVGADLYDGGGGTDTVFLTNGSGGLRVDLRIAGAQDTGAGSDTFVDVENLSLGTTLVASDVLIGNDVANAISLSGGGADQLVGNGGNDVLSVSRYGSEAAAAVSLLGGADNDALYFNSARFSDSVTLDGGDGADIIYATGVGSATVIGGAGFDQVTIDTLGGSFAITLGSDAADVVALAFANGSFRAAGAITIADFTTGAGGDRLALGSWLSSAGLINYGAGSNPFSTGHLKLVQSGADTVLQADRDAAAGTVHALQTLVTFRDTTLAAFTAENLGFTPNDNRTQVGGAGDDRLVGTDAADNLIGLQGSDRLEGGAGMDYLAGDADGYELGYGGDDRLSGGDAFDLIVGGLGADTLNGDGGDDILIGGLAANVTRNATGGFVWAGYYPQFDAGNDSFDGGDGVDQAYLTYTRAEGITVSIADPAVAFRMKAGAAGIGTIRNVERLLFSGGAGDDKVTGGASYDFLYGNGGNDRLAGGDGLDTLFGGVGDDVLDGGARIDTATYSQHAGGVTIDLRITDAQDSGGAGVDRLTGIENVTLGDANGQADTLIGDDAGNALSIGGSGNDTLAGNGGNDVLTINHVDAAAATASMAGGSGNDSLSFNAGGTGRYQETATLDGGDGHDTITATGLGTGTIVGGAGYDTVRVDTLGGSYVIALGADSDTVSLLATFGGFRAAGAITIADFTASTAAGTNDRLTLTEWLGGGALLGYSGGSNPFVSGHLKLVQSGADTWLQADRDGAAGTAHALQTLVMFSNVQASSFSSISFGSFNPFEGVTRLGTSERDTLTGGALDDQLTGLGLADQLDGGAGRDILIGDTLTREPSVAGSDTLRGGADGDALIGGAGDDKLVGGDGDDLLVGGYATRVTRSATSYSVSLARDLAGGADSYDGGDGTDLAYLSFAGAAAVVVNISDPTRVFKIRADGAVTGSIAGVERLNFVGGAGDDQVVGGALYDVLNGGAGDDRLAGGGGDDYLIGGSGDDLLDGGAGSNTAVYVEPTGALAIDLSIQKRAQDTGAAGSDTLVDILNLDIYGAGRFDDVVTGSKDANAVYLSSSGNDRISGAGGGDVISVFSAGGDPASAFTLAGEDGDDAIYLYLEAGDTATVTGGGDDDTIVAYDGSRGSVTVDAGSGDDSVTLGTSGGDHVVTLGAGRDRLFVQQDYSYTQDGSLNVTDFKGGAAGDVLDLSLWLANAADTLTGYVAGADPFRSGHLRFAQAGADTILEVDRDGAGASYAFETIATFRNVAAKTFRGANLDLDGPDPAAGLAAPAAHPHAALVPPLDAVI